MERSAAADDGPLRYRVRHKVPLWRAGEWAQNAAVGFRGGCRTGDLAPFCGSGWAHPASIRTHILPAARNGYPLFVPDGSPMKPISSQNSPVPRLVTLSRSLNEATNAKLDDALVAPPTAHLSGTYWAVVELLDCILVALDEGGEKASLNAKRLILNNVELLLHRCTAFGDYLGQVLFFALPHTGKKNKAASATSDRIEYRIRKLCRLPVNLIKHSGFGMTWIEMDQGATRTSGYCISGPVAERMYAPSKFRTTAAENPEAYSFAYALRELFLSVYDMADIAEAALSQAGLFQHSTADSGLKDTRQAQLQGMVDRLNALPLFGFPDEHGARVPVFSLEREMLLVTTKPLRKLPGAFRIQTELRSVEAGMTYKLPYLGTEVDPKLIGRARLPR